MAIFFLPVFWYKVTHRSGLWELEALNMYLHRLTESFAFFVMVWNVRAIPTYGVYRLYDEQIPNVDTTKGVCNSKGTKEKSINHVHNLC